MSQVFFRYHQDNWIKSTNKVHFSFIPAQAQQCAKETFVMRTYILSCYCGVFMYLLSNLIEMHPSRMHTNPMASGEKSRNYITIQQVELKHEPIITPWPSQLKVLNLPMQLIAMVSRPPLATPLTKLLRRRRSLEALKVAIQVFLHNGWRESDLVQRSWQVENILRTPIIGECYENIDEVSVVGDLYEHAILFIWATMAIEDDPLTHLDALTATLTIAGSWASLQQALADFYAKSATSEANGFLGENVQYIISKIIIQGNDPSHIKRLMAKAANRRYVPWLESPEMDSSPITKEVWSMRLMVATEESPQILQACLLSGRPYLLRPVLAYILLDLRLPMSIIRAYFYYRHPEEFISQIQAFKYIANNYSNNESIKNMANNM